MGVTGCSSCQCSADTCSLGRSEFEALPLGPTDWTEVVGTWEIAEDTAEDGVTKHALHTDNAFAMAVAPYSLPASGDLDWTFGGLAIGHMDDTLRLVYGYDEGSGDFYYVDLFLGNRTQGTSITFGHSSGGSETNRISFPGPSAYWEYGSLEEDSVTTVDFIVCYRASLRRVQFIGMDQPAIYGEGPFPGLKVGVGTRSNSGSFLSFGLSQGCRIAHPELCGQPYCYDCNRADCEMCGEAENTDHLQLTLTNVEPNTNEFFFPYDCDTSCVDDCVISCEPSIDSSSCDVCDGAIGGCNFFNDTHDLEFMGYYQGGGYWSPYALSPPVVYGKFLDPPICQYNLIVVVHTCSATGDPVVEGSAATYSNVWGAFLVRIDCSGRAVVSHPLGFSPDCCNEKHPITFPAGSGLASPYADRGYFACIARGVDGTTGVPPNGATVTITLPIELPSCPTTTTTEPPPEDWWCVDNTESFDCVDVSCIQSAEIPDYVCGGPFPDDTCEGGCGGTTTTTTEPPTTTTTEGPRWACCADPPGQPSCVELEHDEECPEGEVDSFPDEITCINECGVTTTTTCDCADSTGPFPDPSICFLQSSFGTWINAASCQLVGQPCPCCACHPDDGWVCSGDPVVTPNPLLQGVCGTCGGLEGPCP